MKVCAKRLIALFVVGFLLVPSLASAAGETYHYTNDSKDQIIGNGGVFSGDAVFRKSGDAYVPEGKVVTNDPKCKEASLRIVTAASPTKIEKTSGCTPSGLASSISVVSFEENQANCSGAFSWIVCEAIDLLAGWIDGIQRFIASFLVVEPLQNGGPLYQAWQSIKGLANVVFILVYLIAIFAQTLSIGVDAYTAKKVLPRLVIATVLVQFSFLISGLLIDISNVLGAGIGSLMLSATGAGRVTVDPTEFVGLLGVGAAAAGLVGLVSSVLSGAILVSLLGGFFAILAVFFTLVFRQVLISLLVMLAPLAFVAWVLPNTEQYFKLWSKNLVKTLMMYPMITMLFAAGKIVSLAASSTSAQGLGSSDLKAIIAFLAVIAPLVMIPFTFKFAGSALLAGAGALSAISGAGRRRMEGSSGYERFQQRVGMRQNELKQGLGVNAGFGNRVGANRLGKVAGRGIGPWKHLGRGDTAYEARNSAAINRDKNLMGNRFDDEDFPFEGNQVLANGQAWADAEVAKKTEKANGLVSDIKDTDIELGRARASGDSAAISKLTENRGAAVTEYNSLKNQIDRLKKGKVAARPYTGNLAARMASVEFLADNAPGALVDDARIEMAGGENSRGQSVKGYAPIGSGGAERVGNQVWNKAKQKTRKSHPHLAYTEYDGNLDVAGLETFAKGKTQSDWAGFSEATFDVMADNKILNRMIEDPDIETRKQNIEMLNKLAGTGTASAAPAAKQVIRRVLGVNYKPTGGGSGGKDSVDPVIGGGSIDVTEQTQANSAETEIIDEIRNHPVTRRARGEQVNVEIPGSVAYESPASAPASDSNFANEVEQPASGIPAAGDIQSAPVSNPNAGYYYFDGGTGRWKPTTQTDALRREEMGEQVMKPRRQ